MRNEKKSTWGLKWCGFCWLHHTTSRHFNTPKNRELHPRLPSSFKQTLQVFFFFNTLSPPHTQHIQRCTCSLQHNPAAVSSKIQQVLMECCSLQTPEHHLFLPSELFRLPIHLAPTLDRQLHLFQPSNIQLQEQFNHMEQLLGLLAAWMCVYLSMQRLESVCCHCFLRVKWSNILKWVGGSTYLTSGLGSLAAPL